MKKWILSGIFAFAFLAFSTVKLGGKKMNKTTLNKAKAFIKRKYNLEPKGVFIFGIRGASLTEEGAVAFNGNRTDEWNDLICLVDGENCNVYTGTVDPGNHWLNNPMNANGTARIEPGVYQFKRGLHDGRPAFVSASPIAVRRDGNKDKNFDSKDKVFTDTPRNRFGINIHASYGGSKVNRNSAGCTVINAGWNSSEWIEFRNRLYNDRQENFTYVVTDAKDLT